uniref:Uncharacterized protein n=2 Tax=Knipowitschia caucasica TaxID=637954 RepID=A0AAV2JJR1_KNICA
MLSPDAPSGGCGEERAQLHLDLNGNIHSAAAHSDAGDLHGETNTTEHCEPEPRQRGIFPGLSSDSCDTGPMEGGEPSTGTSDESPSEADLPLSRDQASMDLEDSDSGLESGASDRRLSPRTVGALGAEGPGQSLTSAWDLALYEGQCFSEEVRSYALQLGQHSGAAACVDAKSQVRDASWEQRHVFG